MRIVIAMTIMTKYTIANKVPYPTFDRSLYSRKIKLVTLSVAPPGPPEVIFIIISASFNLKIILIRTAVIPVSYTHLTLPTSDLV